MARVINKRKYFKAIGYEPHPRQEEFHNSPARFRIPVCGRRFGKSRMAAADLEPELFLPNRMYWIVGPTFDLGAKEFRYVWQDLIVGQQLGRDKRVKKRFNIRAGEMFIEFPWNTSLAVRSAMHPEYLVGEALHGIILSEAAKLNEEVWTRFLEPSLADYHGWATGPTTPEGQNWLYQWWLRGRDDRHPETASWKFPSWENPYVFPGGENDPEIERLRRSLSTEFFDQEIAALFTVFVGKIYAEFDEMVHIRPHTFNPDWPNYICFDWGFVNPLAAVEFQVDPMDNVYVWREHYRSFTTLPEHVALLKARENPPGYHITCGFGDAEDPEAVAYMSSEFVPTMGMPEAKKNWRQGIDLVNRFMKSYPTGREEDEYGTPEMRPKLTFDPSCVETIREHANYRSKEGSLTRSPRELPQQIDDHTCDALRYGLMHLFELGAKHHLSEVEELVQIGQAGPETFFNSSTLDELGSSHDFIQRDMEF